MTVLNDADRDFWHDVLVESGFTTRNASLARAAVIIGIASAVVSALAIVALIVLIAAHPGSVDSH